MSMTALLDTTTVRQALRGLVRNPGICQPLPTEDWWVDIEALRRHADLQQRFHHRYFTAANRWADDLMERRVQTGERPYGWWVDSVRKFERTSAHNFEGVSCSGRSPWLPPVLVPDRAHAAGAVGGAFDYAMRFALAARHGGVRASLVASQAVEAICSYDFLRKYHKKARDRLRDALATLEVLTVADDLTAQQALACLHLAGLDAFYRAGTLAGLLDEPTAEDANLVRAMFDRVSWELFRPKWRLLLNPTFGNGSLLVGGADADVVLDECLIEVKTALRPVLTMEIIRQLLGYFLLAREFGIDGDSSRRPIERLGVYCARAGYLHLFNVQQVIDEDGLAKFRGVLFREARRLYGTRVIAP